MVLLDQLFVTKCLSKSLWESKSFKNGYQRVQMIDILLKYILWYDFFKRFGCPKWFWQDFCHKKAGQVNHSYLKYALRIFQAFTRGQYSVSRNLLQMSFTTYFSKPDLYRLLDKALQNELFWRRLNETDYRTLYCSILVDTQYNTIRFSHW